MGDAYGLGDLGRPTDAKTLHDDRMKSNAIKIDVTAYRNGEGSATWRTIAS